MRKRDNDQKKKLWIGGFVIAVMVMSTLGFVLSGNDSGASTVDYNGHKIKGQANEWYYKDIRYYYHASDVDQIPVSPEAITKIKNSGQLYFLFDPDSQNIQHIELARFDLTTILWDNFDIHLVPAATKENRLYNISIMSCEDATDNIPIVYFKDSNQTSISIEENCIIAKSVNPFDFLRLRDRIIYGLFEVIGS